MQIRALFTNFHCDKTQFCSHHLLSYIDSYEDYNITETYKTLKTLIDIKQNYKYLHVCTQIQFSVSQNIEKTLTVNLKSNPSSHIKYTFRQYRLALLHICVMLLPHLL